MNKMSCSDEVCSIFVGVVLLICIIQWFIELYMKSPTKTFEQDVKDTLNEAKEYVDKGLNPKDAIVEATKDKHPEVKEASSLAMNHAMNGDSSDVAAKKGIDDHEFKKDVKDSLDKSKEYVDKGLKPKDAIVKATKDKHPKVKEASSLGMNHAMNGDSTDVAAKKGIDDQKNILKASNEAMNNVDNGDTVTEASVKAVNKLT
jgi:hypothetical protein